MGLTGKAGTKATMEQGSEEARDSGTGKMVPKQQPGLKNPGLPVVPLRKTVYEITSNTNH